jgi:hypothetical protein
VHIVYKIGTISKRPLCARWPWVFINGNTLSMDYTCSAYLSEGYQDWLHNGIIAVNAGRPYGVPEDDVYVWESVYDERLVCKKM